MWHTEISSHKIFWSQSRERCISWISMYHRLRKKIKQSLLWWPRLGLWHFLRLKSSLNPVIHNRWTYGQPVLCSIWCSVVSSLSMRKMWPSWSTRLPMMKLIWRKMNSRESAMRARTCWRRCWGRIQVKDQQLLNAYSTDGLHNSSWPTRSIVQVIHISWPPKRALCLVAHLPIFSRERNGGSKED